MESSVGLTVNPTVASTVLTTTYNVRSGGAPARKRLSQVALDDASSAKDDETHRLIRTPHHDMKHYCLLLLVFPNTPHHDMTLSVSGGPWYTSPRHAASPFLTGGLRRRTYLTHLIAFSLRPSPTTYSPYTPHPPLLSGLLPYHDITGSTYRNRAGAGFTLNSS